MSNIKSNIIFMSKFMSKIICQKFEVVYKMGVLIVFFCRGSRGRGSFNPECTTKMFLSQALYYHQQSSDIMHTQLCSKAYWQSKGRQKLTCDRLHTVYVLYICYGFQAI